MVRRAAKSSLLMLTLMLAGMSASCSQDGGGHRRPIARAARAQGKGVIRDMRKKNKLALDQRRQKAASPAKASSDQEMR